jgi:hypothetical protein
VHDVMMVWTHEVNRDSGCAANRSARQKLGLVLAGALAKPLRFAMGQDFDF